jgi:hypothetical protein
VLENMIPQTAEISRESTSPDIEYDGTPRFSPISNTSLEYAENTPSEVIRAPLVFITRVRKASGIGRLPPLDRGSYRTPGPRESRRFLRAIPFITRNLSLSTTPLLTLCMSDICKATAGRFLITASSFTEQAGITAGGMGIIITRDPRHGAFSCATIRGSVGASAEAGLRDNSE